MATPIKSTPIEEAMIARATGRISPTGKDWFGPGEPMAPQAPDSVKGRAFDFPFAVNLSTRPRAEQAATSIPFETLQLVADPAQGGLDLLRLAIETVKDQLTSQKWTVKQKDQVKAKAMARKMDPRAEELKKWLRKPDGVTPWVAWQRQLLEDHLVIDAPTIYPRKAGARMLLEVMDGSTIKRVLDDSGRTPLPPFPAFQQRLKGLPAVDYTLDELIYAPFNLRPNRIYGFSRVEQVVNIINLALKRQLSNTLYWTEGNIPEAMIGVPETWQPNQIQEFQQYWDALMEGNLAARRHMKFVPGGMTPTFTRDPKLKDEMDEWLARVICWAFSLSPTALVKDNNRATSQTSKESSREEGQEVVKLWFKGVMDEAFERAGILDYEFAYQDEEITDPKTKAEVLKIYVDGKILHPNEAREELGRDPLTPEQQDEMNPPPPPALGGDGLEAPGKKPGKTVPKPGTSQGADAGDSASRRLPPAKSSAKDEPTEKLAKTGQKKKLRPIPRNRAAVRRAQKRIQAAAKAYLVKVRKVVVAAILSEVQKLAKADDGLIIQILSTVPKAEREKLERRLVEELGAVAEDGAETGLNQVSLVFPPDSDKDLESMLSQANEQAVAWAEDRAAELVTAIDETTRDRLSDLTMRAMEEGWSNDELASQIEDGDLFSESRAEMIARTETAFADVQGNMAGWKQTGVVEAVQWIIAQDEFCEDCQSLNGQVVPIGEMFTAESGETTEGPPLHPNCRCDLLPVLLTQDEADATDE